MGYHIVACKNDAHATKLHDTVTYTLTSLNSSLSPPALLDPVNLFADDRATFVGQTL